MITRAAAARVAAAGLFTLVSLVILVPMLLLVLGPFRDPTGIVTHGAIALPESWNLHNFSRILVTFHFATYFLNSIIVTVPVVTVSLLLAILAAFALAWMRFPLRGLIGVVVTVVAVMVSEQFIMIPLYVLMKSLHLVDTFLSVILPQVAESAAISTFVIRSFFVSLPEELIDASLEDGCSSWTLLWRILVPIATPAILTCTTLTATWTWNDFILPVVLLPSPARATLPLGLVIFQGGHTIDIPLTITGALVTALPMLVVFFAFQRHVARGLLQGVSR